MQESEEDRAEEYRTEEYRAEGYRTEEYQAEEHRARYIPFMTGIFLAANILVFLYLSLHGSTQDGYYMVRHGTMVPALVLEEGEYSRIFTAFFLHFGFSHLFNNMLLLGYLGVRLEQNVGHIRFALIYLLAGIIGNVCSLFYYISREPYASCAGASGAVFGIVGAMLWLVIRHRGRLEGITARQLLLMTLFTLYNGVTDTGVNNVAHVAGLLSGFLLCVLLTVRRSVLRSHEKEMN